MRRLAVLGHPVGHSRSPAMQNAALAALGLDRDWRYEAIDVAPTEFAARVAQMPGDGFAGANVTVPHKEAALALAASAGDAADQIGAANTLTFTADGPRAENTDAPGLIESLPAGPSGSRALVLGAGGAARAAVWALREAGAEVSVWNRTSEKAERLCAELGGRAVTAAQVAGDGDFDLIVNASAAGLGGKDAMASLPFAPDWFTAEQVVVDMVYGLVPSTLLAAAKLRGATVVDGLEVLVCQGALSFEIWTGEAAPRQVMREAALSAPAPPP